MCANPIYRHWTANGVEAVSATDVRGATPWHSHARLIVGRVERGMRKIVLRGGEMVLPAGAGFVLPPLLAHRTLAADPTDYRVLCLPADQSFCGVSASAIAGDAWCDLFERGFDAVVSGRAEGVVALLTAALPIARRETAGCRAPRAVRRLADELAEDPEDGRSLAQMAAGIGLSPFHLQRLFVRSTGLSPRQARLVARLHRARQMLLNGKPAGETAVACGFSDQAHLSREFRKWTGLPPGRYLEQVHRVRR